MPVMRLYNETACKIKEQSQLHEKSNVNLNEDSVLAGQKEEMVCQSVVK